MKKLLLVFVVFLLFVGVVQVLEYIGIYVFDKKGVYQFVIFKIFYLGYSWLYGNFNEFIGSFMVDEDNLENSKVCVEI